MKMIKNTIETQKTLQLVIEQLKKLDESQDKSELILIKERLDKVEQILEEVKRAII